MKHLESQLERDFVRQCWLVWGIKVSKLKIEGDTGYPDRVVWIPGGRPLFIEFKRSGEKPEPKQSYIHEELRRLGYQVKVCNDLDQSLQAVSDALAATSKS